ncbi:TPA: hypothetical protein NJV69_002569 [Corynebacterium striatum]|nr:hypothetical protein [Corynebacterium striatum]HCG2985206.1 hypothetical protein [Corynebacterium striatum]HCG3001028.1 hypothetical protein [Corynebacterium striatum]HCG3016919.1 hypothetical protein [Corynebacterium striatum]HCG3143550.1 hypothetical protein [Corynebacterium striatum]
MTKTLAELAPEQRTECVGMWCEYPNTRDRLGIIYTLDDDNDPWILRFDVRTEILGYDAKEVIPRFDLPRAWNPDGTPVSREWEYAVQYLTPGGWEYSRESWDCRWQDSEAVQEVRAYRDHPGQETRIVRRIVGSPEVTEM